MIKPRTLFIMCLLVALLFLLIEAADAGFLSLWRQELEQTVSPFFVVFSGIAIMVLTLVYFAIFDKSLNITEARDKEF
ncbi:MAG: hypothetical protein MUF75_01210 [Bacteroidia bacterium]|jgi:preprotein translocase subunit Sec61beta|nr:hypothetical protein [Bacteroidia bacterium]